MQPTNQEISQQFSKGNFSFCYNHFSDDVEWKIVGNKVVKGKENVITQCEQMTGEMVSATLNNFNTVAENASIAIEGNCSFVSRDGKPGEVSYCDVYRFDNGKVATITSYCLETQDK